jgi:hypothetical protein
MVTTPWWTTWLGLTITTAATTIIAFAALVLIELIDEWIS